MADKSKNKSKHKTPQDKHKHSAFTAADNLKYQKYRNRQTAKGNKPKPKRKWYNSKKKKKD